MNFGSTLYTHFSLLRQVSSYLLVHVVEHEAHDRRLLKHLAFLLI